MRFEHSSVPSYSHSVLVCCTQTRLVTLAVALVLVVGCDVGTVDVEHESKANVRNRTEQPAAFEWATPIAGVKNELPEDYIDPSQKRFGIEDYVSSQPEGYLESEEGKWAAKLLESRSKIKPIGGGIGIRVERNERQIEAYRRRLAKLKEEQAAEQDSGELPSLNEAPTAPSKR